MDDCIFCKIVAGEIPSAKVYEDDHVLAFRDIDPVAPVHIIVIPKAHFETIMDLDETTTGLMMKAVQGVIKTEGLEQRGFRLAANTGPEGGQVVMHAHWHVIGGRKLTPEMG